MDRQVLCKQITQTQNETERLLRELQTLYHTDPSSTPEIYEKISIGAALLSERITCRLRHLVYDMTEMKKSEYLVAAGEAHGIEINYEDGIFEITIPRLLPKRKKWDSLFPKQKQFPQSLVLILRISLQDQCHLNILGKNH